MAPKDVATIQPTELSPHKKRVLHFFSRRIFSRPVFLKGVKFDGLNSHCIAFLMYIYPMKKLFIATILPVLFQSGIMAQADRLTVAEKSDYTSTATSLEVNSFLSALTARSNLCRAETLAMTISGKPVPLLVIADPLPASDADLKDDERIVVYIQANIHAGEVEGKEASLMLARELVSDEGRSWLKNVIVLICPNLNPDGNDQISTLHRTDQNGPKNGVGVRHNGQYLDLNRDAMKLETPEMRGVVTHVLNRWDPAVIIDCHTTNGSFHEEPVTFTWMMNPNGDTALIHHMRDSVMPRISSILQDQHGVENCFYGEFVDMKYPALGWEAYGAEPRYFVNYAGIRNRFAILNENYVYADYKTRVLGCHKLLLSIIEYASLHGSELKEFIAHADQSALLRGADPSVRDSFALVYKGRPTPTPITIKAFEVEETGDTLFWNKYRKTDRKIKVTVPYLAEYYPSESIKFPYAYLLKVTDPVYRDFLRLHGIQVETLAVEQEIEVESFLIDAIIHVRRLNQGHYTNTVKGKYRKEKISFPAGCGVIRTSQPLANLAAYLLEPQSDDGMAVWNMVDRYLVPQWGPGYYPWPVCRVVEKTELKTISGER
jgi:dipeptidyl-peptidase-4